MRQPGRARQAAAVAVLMVVSATGTACAGGRSTAQPPASVAPGAVVTTATGSPTPTGSAGRADAGHVVVVIFENKSSAQLQGNPDAPYLNSLMKRAAVFANAHGVAHPSQPNYLALLSGSTHGVTDDHCPVRLGNQPNLAQQLRGAGLTFTGYAEDLPAPGYRGCSRGEYAAKHNPWADFANIPAGDDQPLSAWPTDHSRLPTVAFVVPNMCHDMHDCPIGTGDDWARSHLDPYLRWADTHHSQLVVTFDENDGSPGNQILTLVAGADVRPGVHDETVDHYSLLRAIEDRYRLTPLGGAAAATPLPYTG